MWSNKKVSDGMIPHHVWMVAPKRSRCWLNHSKIIVPSCPPLNIVTINSHLIQIMSTPQIIFM